MEHAGCSATRPAPEDRRRSRSTTVRRSCGCWSAARPVAARRTWTASGPARIWRPCCGSPHGTASRCRCLPAGSRVLQLPPHARPPDAAQYARRARRNIAAHYDLGNDFYRLFLDETLTYSCAVFETPDQTLADAQRNKYRQIAAGAGLSAGQHVLEIGSGWGGFAVRGARARLPRDDDHDLARAARARNRAGSRSGTRASRRRPAARLPRSAGRTTRSSRSRCSRPSGRSTSGRSSRPAIGRCGPAAPEPPGDHLSRRRLRAAVARGELDPDVHLPGRPVPVARGARAGNQPDALLVRSVTDIAPSYVLTLRSWRERFMARTDAVRALGFDDRFIRMWEYYLALSEGGLRDRHQPGPPDRVREGSRPRLTGRARVTGARGGAPRRAGARDPLPATDRGRAARWPRVRQRRGRCRAPAPVRNRLSRRRPVRSRWIGVTAIRRFTTAWKSVPSTASPDGGGPPVQ